MARKTTPAPESKETPVNELVIAEDFSAANTLALAHREADTRTRAVALQLGYQLPADCTDPDLIQRDISANMRRSVEACLEVGKGLRVLKEACEHGNFMARLDVLCIEGSVARRFMESATRFSKRATSHVLAAAGGQSKLFEMLILDSDQVEELELTGQTGELDLDDVARMSVKELRAAVRKEREAKKKAEKVTERLQAVNLELHGEVARIAKEEPGEALDGLRAETAKVAHETLGKVEGHLRQGFVALADHHMMHGGDSRQFMAGYLAQLQQVLNGMREEFQLKDTVGDGTPAWQVWANAQEPSAG